MCIDPAKTAAVQPALADELDDFAVRHHSGLVHEKDVATCVVAAIAYVTRRRSDWLVLESVGPRYLIVIFSTSQRVHDPL